MQTGRDPAQDSLSKPIMLALTTAVVVGIVVPLILPHLAHPSMIYHITLHIASITIAVFLRIGSILAYTRNTNTRMLLMAIGFVALAGVELLYLLDATGTVAMLEIPEINVEFPHLILLVMLTMFGLGVLKVNK
jgi:hypothetical protein